MNKPKRIRRENALWRLQSQLETGVKNTKEGVVPLSEKDIKRINREIGILESRI